MENPIIKMLQGATAQASPSSNIMMQAVGAMLRGESPQSFLRKLAETNPQLQGLDLDHPEQAAQKLYEQNGQDYSQAKSSIRDKISNLMNNSK